MFPFTFLAVAPFGRLTLMRIVRRNCITL